MSAWINVIVENGNTTWDTGSSISKDSLIKRMRKVSQECSGMVNGNDNGMAESFSRRLPKAAPVRVMLWRWKYSVKYSGS